MAVGAKRLAAFRGKTDAGGQSSAKPFYQMTLEEFAPHAGSEYTAGDRFGVYTHNNAPAVPGTLNSEAGEHAGVRIHRAVIRKAIHEGQEVPAHVIDRYADLKQMQAHKAAGGYLPHYSGTSVDRDFTPRVKQALAHHAAGDKGRVDVALTNMTLPEQRQFYKHAGVKPPEEAPPVVVKQRAPKQGVSHNEVAGHLHAAGMPTAVRMYGGRVEQGGIQVRAVPGGKVAVDHVGWKDGGDRGETLQKAAEHLRGKGYTVEHDHPGMALMVSKPASPPTTGGDTKAPTQRGPIQTGKRGGRYATLPSGRKVYLN